MKIVNFLSLVDRDKCIGDRLCEKACPTSAIKVIEKKARVDEERCVACTKCVEVCCENAVSMAPREHPLNIFMNTEAADQAEIADLCANARCSPDQLYCACTGTLAREVAAAILAGAESPEDIILMTGAGSGCGIYCMGAIFTMFKAAGIMIPMVNTPEEAEQAVAAMRYPPEGIRGMTSGSRAADYGFGFPDYYARANQDLLTVCQIETKQGVENAEAIAAVDGVDVLFIGPSDLTLNLGCYKKLDHPEFRKCLQRIVAACRSTGKQGGILLGSPTDIPGAIDDGLTFIALGV